MSVLGPLQQARISAMSRGELNLNYAHAHTLCTRLFSLPARKEPGYEARLRPCEQYYMLVL